jgi:hypothetical protein
MNTFTPAIEKLAKDWFRRCRESQMIHYEYGSVLERRHLYFGISAIVLSTIVGTAVFSTWESAAIDGWLRVLLGLLSMISAAVAALQTFLNLLDRAAKHKAAGANYGAIRRELELLKTIPPETEDKIKEALEAIKSRMDELTASVPGIPSRFKQRIDDKLRSRAYDRIYQLEPNSAPSDDSDLPY